MPGCTSLCHVCLLLNADPIPSEQLQCGYLFQCSIEFDHHSELDKHGIGYHSVMNQCKCLSPTGGR